MITVHHLEHSRSQRLLWLLEELGLDYRIKHYKRDPKTRLAPPELRKVHPLGKSPVLTDGDEVLAESGAIMETLCERYDPDHKLLPAHGTPEHRRVRYWLHYAEGSIMPWLLMTLVFSSLPKQKMPFFVKPVVQGISGKVHAKLLDPQIALHRDYLEAELGKSTWFGGETLTVADVAMSLPVQGLAARAGLERHPRLQAFLERVESRPGWKAALEKGGPYELGR